MGDITMKLTKDRLKQIIKEELNNLLSEQDLEEGFLDNIAGKVKGFFGGKKNQPPPPPPVAAGAAPKAQFNFNKLGNSYNGDYLVNGKPRTEQEVFNMAVKGSTQLITLKDGTEKTAEQIVKTLGMGNEMLAARRERVPPTPKPGTNTNPAVTSRKPPPPPPPTKELKPGDQVQFKDPDSIGGMIQGNIIPNDQALKLLDQYWERNTPDSRKYGYDDATKLQRQPDSYFFINPLRSIRQNGVGQSPRSFYVIDKKILTKIGPTASSTAQPPPPPGKTPPPPPKK